MLIGEKISATSSTAHATTGAVFPGSCRSGRCHDARMDANHNHNDAYAKMPGIDLATYPAIAPTPALPASGRGGRQHPMHAMSTLSNAVGAPLLISEASHIARRAPSPACGGGLRWGLSHRPTGRWVPIAGINPKGFRCPQIRDRKSLLMMQRSCESSLISPGSLPICAPKFDGASQGDVPSRRC